MELVQGNMIVREYMTQFERLSRFTPYMVDTPGRRIRKNVQGLRAPLRSYIIGHQDRTFKAFVTMAVALERDIHDNKKERESQSLQANSPVQVVSTEGRNFRNNHFEHKRPRDGERKVNT